MHGMVCAFFASAAADLPLSRWHCDSSSDGNQHRWRMHGTIIPTKILKSQTLGQDSTEREAVTRDKRASKDAEVDIPFYEARYINSVMSTI